MGGLWVSMVGMACETANFIAFFETEWSLGPLGKIEISFKPLSLDPGQRVVGWGSGFRMTIGTKGLSRAENKEACHQSQNEDLECKKA